MAAKPFDNPYSLANVWASCWPSEKRALRSRGNNGDSVGNRSALVKDPASTAVEGVGAEVMIGVTLGGSALRLMGDWKGVARGRRSGRSGVVKDSRPRVALCLRASLQIKSREGQHEKKSRLTNCADSF